MAAARRVPWWLLMAGVALTAAVAAYLLQRRGISTSPDGTVYTGVATNLAKGRGLSVPFTIYTDHYSPRASIRFGPMVPLRQWPPLYPAILSVLVRTGLTGDGAARVLNPALLGVNVLMLALLTRRLFTQQWAALLTTLLLLTLVRDPSPVSSSLLYLHVTTLAEPFFLFLVLGVLIAADLHLSNRRVGWLIVAATLASMALLTKVVGLAAVVVVALVAVAGASSWWSRVWRLLLCLAVGVVPSLPTMLRATRRRAGPSWNEVGTVTEGLRDGLAELVAPPQAPMIMRLMIFGLVVGATVVALLWIVRRDPGRRPDVVRLAPTGLLALLMLVQLVGSRLFVDRYVSLTGRQLSIVQVLGLVVVLGTLSLGLAAAALRMTTVVIVIVVLVTTTLGSGAALVSSIVDPPYFKRSSTLPPRALALAERSPNVFSNAPDYVYASTGAGSYLVPCRRDYYSGADRPDFAAEVAELQNLIADGSSSVILVGGRLGTSADCASVFDFLADARLQIQQIDRSTAVVSRRTG